MTLLSRRRPQSSAAVLLLLALVGCGSTVSGPVVAGTSDGTAPAGSDLAPDAGPPLDPTLSSGIEDAPLGGGATVTTAPRAGERGGPPGAAGSSTAPDGASVDSRPGPSAPGVTAKDIRIGIVYFANGDQAAKAAGVNLSRGDERRNWEAVIDEVNARGGVAGRRVVGVYYAYDAQSTEPMDAQEQAACTRFTQDERVFAVVTNGTENFTACLTKAGVLHSTTGSYVYHDKAFLRRFPTFFTQRPSQDRMMADLVAALRRQSYFTGWDTSRGAPGTAKTKVGIITIDEPVVLRPLETVLLPALRVAGHPVDPAGVYRVPSSPSAGQAGPGAAAMQNAVLRFRQEGVTHAIVLDMNGATTFLFAQHSARQMYYPRMGVNSASGIQQLYDLGVMEARQLNGATGLGWTPTLDLPAGTADRYLSSAAKDCLEVIKRRTGQVFSSTTAAGVAMLSCDAVFPFATSLRSLRGPLTVQIAVRAIESVGDTLLAASVPRLVFSPSRHDGLEIAFDMAWESSCSCVRYRDNGHRMP